MSDKQLLMEMNIQDIIRYIVEDTGKSIKEAMLLFYSSITFEKLQDTETALYLQSSAYIYELFKDEMENGGFIQKEI